MKHPPFACLLAGAIAFLLGATAVVSAAGVPKK
jgi:hypothetical protein